MQEQCKICNKKFKSKLAISIHCHKTHHISPKQYYDLYFKTPSEGKCIVCNSQTAFINLTKGYLAHCSCKCAGNNQLSKDKVKQTNIKKYGVDSVMKVDSIKGKLKSQYKLKTGYETPLQNPEVKEKIKNSVRKKTKEEKYKIMQKQRETKLFKYGNADYNNKQKTKTTCIEKYGVDNILKSKECRLKNKQILNKKAYEKLIKNSDFSLKIQPLFTFEEYIDVKTQYSFKCLKCGNIFYDNLDNGKIPRCTTCYPYNASVSHLESELFEFSKQKLSSCIIRNDTTVISPHEIDLYFPNNGVAVEFNGNYWHSELNGKDKLYHLEKLNKCINKNIHLIQIFEDEWVNKKEIVMSRLNLIFNKNVETIFARKCIIREISDEEKRVFLYNNHMQGDDKSSIKLGAFFKDNLVSVMTFGKERIALGNSSQHNDVYEMYRFCSSLNIKIIGIFKKLLSYFIQNYNPKKIISYADRRWVNEQNNIYLKSGFTHVSTSTPNYWYINKSNYLKREHRYSYRKHILQSKLCVFDNNLSEWQNMQLNGYDRIWDCGNLKYEMTVKN